MITAIINAIQSAVEGFSKAVVSGLEALVGCFYDSTAQTLTNVGTLVMVALGIGIVYWLFGWVRSLIHLRG